MTRQDRRCTWREQALPGSNSTDACPIAQARKLAGKGEFSSSELRLKWAQARPSPCSLSLNARSRVLRATPGKQHTLGERGCPALSPHGACVGRRAAGYLPSLASGQVGGQGIAEGHLLSLPPCQQGRVGWASAILGSEGKRRRLFTAVPRLSPPPLLRRAWGLGPQPS